MPLATNGSSLSGALARFIDNDLARGAIATILIVGTFVLLAMGRDVPSVLWAMDGAAVSAFFAVRVTRDSYREK